MRILSVATLALATLFGASAHASITAQQAASRIKAAIPQAKVITDKGGTFRTKLGPVKKGTKYVRTFTANNERPMIFASGGPGSTKLGGARITVGGIATGEVNLQTEKVKFFSYSQAKGMQRPTTVTLPE